MQRRNRLTPLRKLAAFNESDNARRLADRLRTVQIEEQRLLQISGFLTEYEQHAAAIRGSVGVRSLQTARQFVERLRAAVAEQKASTETQRQLAEQQAVAWRAARARAKSLERLEQRAEDDERDRRDRREQVTLDEIARDQAQRNREV